jgi:hypothetical protein
LVYSQQTLQTFRGSSSSNDNNWKVVWTKNQIITTEGFLSKEITWDGKMILETK